MAEDATKEVVAPTGEENANTEASGSESTESAKENTASAELSPTEQLAASQGWVQLDKWQGDPKDHRSAKEFVDRGELLGKIRSQSQEMQKLTAIVNTLSDHNKKVYQAGYENALKELRAAKATAIENNDGKALVAIEERIDETKEKLAAVKQAPAQGTQAVPLSADYQLFLQRNPQYLTSATYRMWAQGVAKVFAQENPNLTEGDVYAFVEEEAEKEWPGRYKPNGAQAAKVKGPPSPNGDGKSPTGSKADNKSAASFESILASMPEDQQKVARDMVKRGTVTKEKYVQDYQMIGGN